MRCMCSLAVILTEGITEPIRIRVSYVFCIYALALTNSEQV